MAVNNFIPTIWSEKLWRELDRKYIGAAHCCRDYEGDIKEKGNKVKILGTETVSINNYAKNTNMSSPQAISDNCRELVINQAKYFNFQIDDVDHAQAVPGLMDNVIHAAAEKLALVADEYIFSLYDDAGYVLETDNRDTEALFKTFLNARTILYRSNVNNSDDLVLEVTPEVARYLLEGKMALQTDNTETLDNGCIGKLFGVKVYVTNSVFQDYNTSDPEGPIGYHKCLMRSKRAIAYASQISEIEAYRPELRFADAVKGLHLYGAKVIYPEEMITIDVGIYDEI